MGGLEMCKAGIVFGLFHSYLDLLLETRCIYDPNGLVVRSYNQRVCFSG
jgi:hypothetical protein